MLSLIAAAALAQHSSIDLAGAYYTLEELAAALRARQIKVQVDPSCAQDVYSIRSVKTHWEDLKIALESDQRLEIRQTPAKEWVIARSRKDAMVQADAATRFVESVKKSINSVYEGAIEKSAELTALEGDDLDLALRKLVPPPSGSSPAFGLYNLTYLYADAHDIPFYSLSIPAYFTAPKQRSPFWRLEQTNLTKAPALMVPSGNLRDFKAMGIDAKDLTESQLAEFGNGFEVAAKVVLDPMSLTAASRMVFNITQGGRVFRGEGKEDMCPSRFELRVPTQDVWQPEARTAISERAKASDAAMKGIPWTLTANFTSGSIRLSAVLLAAAEQSGRNLVYYVSPFTDPVVLGKAQVSLSEILSDVEGQRVDANWRNTTIHERVTSNESWKPKQGYRADRAFTESYARGFMVVRNESRFLDGLSASSPDVPTKWSNKILHRESIDLTEVAKQISGLPIKGWKSSLFASNFLQVCNPLSFKPIAVLIEKSPKLLKALESDSGALPLHDLESEAQTGFASAIRECSAYCDAGPLKPGEHQGDPLLAPGFLKDNPNAELSYVKSDLGWQFRVLGERNLVIWSTWVRHVAL